MVIHGVPSRSTIAGWMRVTARAAVAVHSASSAGYCASRSRLRRVGKTSPISPASARAQAAAGSRPVRGHRLPAVGARVGAGGQAGEIEQRVEAPGDRRGRRRHPVGEGQEQRRVEPGAGRLQHLGPGRGAGVEPRAPGGEVGGGFAGAGPVPEDHARLLERLARSGDAGGGVGRLERREPLRQCRIGGNRRVAGIDPPAGEDHRPAGEGGGGVPLEEEQFPAARRRARAGADRSRVAEQDDRRGGDGGVGVAHFVVASVRYRANHARMALFSAVSCDGRSARPWWLAPGTRIRPVGTLRMVRAA